MFGTGAHAGSFADDDPFGDLLSYVEENTDVPYTGLGLDDNAEASGVSIRTEEEMTGEEIDELLEGEDDVDDAAVEQMTNEEIDELLEDEHPGIDLTEMTDEQVRPSYGTRWPRGGPTP